MFAGKNPQHIEWHVSQGPFHEIPSSLCESNIAMENPQILFADVPSKHLHLIQGGISQLASASKSQLQSHWNPPIISQ